MRVISIPAGKEVRIYRDQLPIVERPLILEEDISLNFQSSFSTLLGDQANKFLTLAGGVSKDFLNIGFTGQFKQFGYQIWEKTEPVSLSFSVGLYMETNAEFDVVDPSEELIKLALPEDAGLSNQGAGLIAPGPTLTEALGKKTGRSLYLSAGYIFLRPIIVKKVEPLYSLETDQFGYPIWCILRIDIETVFTATTNMIDSFKFSRRPKTGA
jgi:hypothetical protein